MHFCKNPKPQKEQDALLSKLKGTRKIKIQELEKLNLENENLNGLIEESKDAKVVVHKRIYPGVKILISDKKYEVNEERNRGIFLLKGGQIIFEPT
ncbi:MAG: DUF342 domain-containing protein [Proteobacteria bacterium]|nr:MAG: DUF342 domain-containing protein [Pseudomonadota bacterium]